MTWETLPPEFAAAVQEVTGPVARAQSSPRRVAGLAVGMEAGKGRFFLKAVEAAGPAYSALERECRITATMPAGRVPAPALVDAVDAGGWAGLLFEYAPGRDANLSPGSADVPAVAAMLATLSRIPAWPELPPLQDDIPVLMETAKIADSLPDAFQRALADTLSRFSPEDLKGDRLVHYDLSPQNIRVNGPGEVALVDWESACAGPEWADSVMAMMLLVMDGHSPSAAEQAVPAMALREAPDDAADGLLALLTLNCLYAARHGQLGDTRVRVRAAEAGQALLAYRAASRTQRAGTR